MLRPIILLTFLTMAWGDEQFKIIMEKHCRKLLQTGMRCCKRELPNNVDKNVDYGSIYRECSQLQNKLPSCERDICLATKHGYYTAEGTIDKQNLVALLEKEMGVNQDIIPILKDKCINGDRSPYGLEDECDLLKLNSCMNIQMMGHCPNWIDEEHCKGVEEAAQECLQQFP